jgi:DUF4097 and DUF4098 domain-containing protein YvlB
MKFREILLAILIIGLGVLIYYGKTGRLDLTWEGPDGFIFGTWDAFDFEETQVLPDPLPAELEVTNAHGSVDIRGGQTDKITVTFKKTLYRKSKEAAQKDAGLLKMIVTRTGATLGLATNRDEFKRRNFETHFTITLPAKTTVRVRNSYGPVNVVRTGPTDIGNPHGEVRASEIAGPLTAENSYENISINGVEGDCRVTGPHSDVSVADVAGACTVAHSYGELRLEKVRRTVDVKGSHSKITGVGLNGDVRIENSYEPIVLAETGPVTVRAHHCDIEAKTLTGRLDISDRYARIEITGVQGDLAIDSPNSEISAEAVAAAEIALGSTYRNVSLRGFTGRATITLSHGDLTLEPAAVTGPIDVQATYANVRFGWPAGGRFPFEGRTKSGEIFWSLADRPSIEETNGQSLTKAFLNETGKPAIQITTSYGNIRIEEVRRPGGKI